jgi:hypothetical protein
MNKLEFMQKLQSARAEWDDLIAQAQSLGEEAMMSSSEDDGWSLKDFVAHNIWYEREIVRLLTTRNLSHPPSDELWATRNDERNQALYDMFREMPLTDVLAEEKQTYKELLTEIRKLNDVELNDPRRFTDMPMDWIPWKVLAENSYEHYSAHLDDIKHLVSLLAGSKHPTPDI